LPFTLLQAIILAGSLHGLILSIVISFRKPLKTSLAVRYLSLFIAVMSLINIRNILEIKVSNQQFSVLFLLSSTLACILGPCIYLFVKHLIDCQQLRNSKDLKHFLLPIIYAVIIVFISSQGITSHQQIQGSALLTSIASIIQSIVFISLLSYLISCSILLKRAKNRLTDHLANTDNIGLNFVRYLVSALCLIFLFWLILFGADIEILRQQRTQNTLELFWLSMSLLIYWLGYYCLLNPQLFNLSLTEVHSSSVISPKYDHKADTTKTNEHENIKHSTQILLNFMQQNKPYLDPEINLKSLADMTNLKPKELTYILNHELNTTFYKFINRYRIDQIKLRLQHPNSLNEKLEIIAYESGIKSSSTFNRLFKQYEDITPKQYRSQFIESSP